MFRFSNSAVASIALCILHMLSICCAVAQPLSRESGSLLDALRDSRAERSKTLDATPAQALGNSPDEPFAEPASTVPAQVSPADETERRWQRNRPVFTDVLPPPQDTTLFLPPTVDPSNALLRTFIQTALDNSPELCVARARICASEAKWQQVGMRPNPSVGLSAQEVGNDGKLGQWGLQINKRISRGNKLGLNRSVVSHETEQLRVQLRMDSARLRNDVERAFFQALASAHRVHVLQQLMAMADETVARVTLGMRAQELARTDLLQSELDLDAARIDVEAAMDAHRSTTRRLAALLHVPDDGVPELSGDSVGALPEFGWSATLREMLDNSPAVQQQNYVVEAAKCTVARQQADQIPDINVGLTVAYDDTSNDPIASFTIGRPLLLRDDNRGAIQQAKSALTAAVCELEVVQLRSREKLAEAIRHYDGARRRVDRYTSIILPRAVEHLELIRAAAYAGEAEFTTYHVAQREYATYYKQFLQSLEDAWEYHWEMRNLLDGVTR